ncbi:MAG TPA: hypothetical protein PK264_21890 [Hyphomicrobiaceae bacterium]|nr:hypothetical protein [Hyphomicrobiaceae bacterium]
MRRLPLASSLAAAALAAALVPAFAAANPQKSVYSTIDLKRDCRIVKKHQDGNSWSCKGLTGYPLYVAEGDLRFFVSAGASPEKRRAATQTLAGFNSIFKDDKTNRATLEWRVANPGPKATPYATILRYYLSVDGKKWQTLVVMKVTPTETCHVAHVDAALPNAVAVAREIADGAAAFDCTKEPVERKK